MQGAEAFAAPHLVSPHSHLCLASAHQPGSSQEPTTWGRRLGTIPLGGLLITGDFYKTDRPLGQSSSELPYPVRNPDDASEWPSMSQRALWPLMATPASL